MTNKYTQSQKKISIFNAIIVAFEKMEDEPLMPVVVSYSGAFKTIDISSISPEIVKNAQVILNYCGIDVTLESALSKFVLEYLHEEKSGFENDEGGEGTVEFDAKNNTVTVFHSNFERVSVPEEPVLA